MKNKLITLLLAVFILLPTLTSCSAPHQKQVYHVGDIITFGSYEQDGNIKNGKEDIAWCILAVEENRLLLLSEKILDAQPYNNNRVDITWGTCSLRAWLNDDFFHEAFTAEEQTQIVDTSLTNDNNSAHTTDKIFLFSTEEANQYLDSSISKIARPTEYAMKNIAYTYDRDQDGLPEAYWWLRSSGSTNRRAASVNNNRIFHFLGDFPTSASLGIRPAIWITI